MKILQVIPSMDSRYGGPVFVAGLASRLLGIHEVPNAILTIDCAQTRQNHNIVGYKRSFNLWDFSLDFFINAHKEVKNCDGLLIHGLYSSLTLWTCILSMIYGKKVFLRPAGMLDFDSIFSGSGKKILFRVFYLLFTSVIIYMASSRIVFNSSKEINNSLFGKSKKAIILPNGVDPALFEVDQKNKIYKKKFKVFFMGRLDKIKGIDLIVDAFSGLEKDISENIELIVAGDGDEEFVENLKSRSSSNIIFIGHVEGSLKYQYLKECDIYLQPSKTEGLSNSMLEAMFCSVAMITTKHVGLSQELEDHEAAEIISFDVRELRNAIVKLVQSRSLVQKYKSNALEFVEKNYDFNENIKNYISLFRAECNCL